MALPLSPSERELAYRLLGIAGHDVLRGGEDELKQLKARVRKAFKALVPQYHPDTNGGDPEKTAIFSLLVRASKEVYGLRAVSRGDQPAVKWRINTVSVPVSGIKEPMQANVRRSRANGSRRPDLREQAARLGKLRP